MTATDGQRYLQARSLVDAERWRDAAATLAPLLGGDPPSAPLALAAEVALAFGAYAEACELARRAVDSGTQPDAQARLRLLRLLRRLEMPAEIERVLDTESGGASTREADAEAVLIASSAGLHERAEQRVEALLERAPGFADAHYLAGMLDMFAGRREASLQALDRALAIEPRMANAHWLIAMQSSGSEAAPRVRQLREALRGIVPDTEAEAYAHFSLHRHLHRLGRFEEAWTALEAGMRVAGRLDPYDRARTAALFEAIRRTRLPAFVPRPRPAGDVALVFIVGMFRSGPSLIERVVTRHPDVMDGGETFQFTAALREAADYESRDVVDEQLLALAPRLDFEAVRTRVLDYARWRARGRGWLTEKLPSNFLGIGLIAHAFPEARIIHLRRDPVATCFSNLRTYVRGTAGYSNSVDDVADYYRRYDALMAHWRTLLPGRILDVVYEEFVSDPETQARRILDYCGLPFDAAVLDPTSGRGHSATASAADVRTGIQRDRGREWEPYRGQLAPLLPLR
ncbi:tetratricopeptide repeat-containing sulfotransferase family protein [Cognatilysobacter segetis]|uniref:tetratricopeptide repeat-containing sulfotransferase family protein n=1 Tax=Cognatilysobacter segetis TaxID=2492394 RepID=UPI00106022B2|nr:sulfotransferase [Lysobacter segetis]